MRNVLDCEAGVDRAIRARVQNEERWRVRILHWFGDEKRETDSGLLRW